MHAITISGKNEAIDLKESEKRYTGELGGKKGSLHYVNIYPFLYLKLLISSTLAAGKNKPRAHTGV